MGGGTDVLILDGLEEGSGGDLGGHEQAGEGEDESLDCETHGVLYWWVFELEVGWAVRLMGYWLLGFITVGSGGRLGRKGGACFSYMPSIGLSG